MKIMVNTMSIGFKKKTVASIFLYGALLMVKYWCRDVVVKNFEAEMHLYIITPLLFYMSLLFYVLVFSALAHVYCGSINPLCLCVFMSV